MITEDHNGNKYLYFLCYPPQYLYIILCIFMFLLRNKSIQYNKICNRGKKVADAECNIQIDGKIIERISQCKF